MTRSINYLLVFLFVAMVIPGFGQCDIPGGSFEEYIEYSDSIEPLTGVAVDGPVYVSQHFSPAFRPGLLFFFTFLGAFSGQELIDLSPNFFGQERFSPGANDSEFALELRPDNFLNLADAINLPFACAERPASMRGSYLHRGSELDSAIIYVVFGSDSLLTTLDDITAIDDDKVAGYGIMTIQGGTQEYSEFEIPITYNDNDVPVDSALILILAIGDSTFLANGNSVSYVFDEFSFNGLVDATENNSISQHITMYPNPAQNQLNINNDSGIGINTLNVWDVSGKLFQKQIINSSSDFLIDLHDLNSGYYLIEILTPEGIITKPLMKY